MEVARLLVEVNANTAQAEAGLARLSGSINAFALGGAVMVVAAGVAAAAAVKMAGDFEQGVTTLVTGAGLGAQYVGMVSDRIKTMAVDTGTSTKQLIDGMFMISSAGFPAAKALDILRIAAEGAKVGNADLGTVADAVTTILKDYPGVANGAAGAMNALVATVANGKTHMQDLADSISHVLPAAAAAKISLNDVMGAMATMTGEGTRAADASTYLRQTIISLMAPGDQAKNTLLSIGLTAGDVAKDLQDPHIGLAGTLGIITDHLKNKFPVGSAAYVAALKNIGGGSKTFQGILQLTGAHLQDFKDNVGKVSDQVRKGGKDVKGWSDVQKDMNFQLGRAKEAVETAFITIGQKLLPKVTEITKYLVDHAGPAIHGLTKFWEDHKAAIIIAAAAVGGILVAAFVAWAVAAGAAALATLAAMLPIIAIGAAIGVLVAGIIWAYQNWGWFRDAVHVAALELGAMKDVVGMALGWLGDLKDAIGWVAGKLGDLLTALGLLPGAQAKANLTPGGSEGFKSPLKHHASGTSFAPGGLSVLAEGGPELISRPGVYNVPRGSRVLNAKDTAKALGGVTNNYNIYPAKAEFGPEDMQRLQRRHALLANTSGGYA
jgi:TP901 family phage tail tape measure protein